MITLLFSVGTGMTITPTLIIHANVSELSTSDNEYNNASLLDILSTVNDPPWYPNNGATHQVTRDPNVYTTKHFY